MICSNYEFKSFIANSRQARAIPEYKSINICSEFTDFIRINVRVAACVGQNFLLRKNLWLYIRYPGQALNYSWISAHVQG